MRTLIIPDIHNKIQWAEDVIHFEERDGGIIDEIVFLGDYFDAFGDTLFDMACTADWLVGSVKDKRRVHLLGNHDASYLHYQLRCSGHTHGKQVYMDSREDVRSLLLSLPTEHRVGPWLLSHAGVGERFSTWRSLNPRKKLFDVNGYVTPVGWISVAATGSNAYSGPLWHRPWEAVSGRDKYAGVCQVFGHTKGVEPRIWVNSRPGGEFEGLLKTPVRVVPLNPKGEMEDQISVCLDTDGHSYAVIDHDGWILTVKKREGGE
jgi:hypothetical protein